MGEHQEKPATPRGAALLLTMAMLSFAAGGCSDGTREIGWYPGETSTTSSNSGDLGFDASAPQTACAVAAQQQADATCKLDVFIDTFVPSWAECWVDSPLKEGQPGQLELACGDGAATLTFPSGVFVGTNTDCNLDLTLATQFDFVDGCKWESTQKIVGYMEGQVSYTYSEKPIAGSQCATPCTVDAKLSFGQTTPVEVGPPK